MRGTTTAAKKYTRINFVGNTHPREDSGSKECHRLKGLSFWCLSLGLVLAVLPACKTESSDNQDGWVCNAPPHGPLQLPIPHSLKPISHQYFFAAGFPMHTPLSPPQAASRGTSEAMDEGAHLSVCCNYKVGVLRLKQPHLGSPFSRTWFSKLPSVVRCGWWMHAPCSKR